MLASLCFCLPQRTSWLKDSPPGRAGLVSLVYSALLVPFFIPWNLRDLLDYSAKYAFYTDYLFFWCKVLALGLLCERFHGKLGAKLHPATGLVLILGCVLLAYSVNS
jgi:hypothetical protein